MGLWVNLSEDLKAQILRAAAKNKRPPSDEVIARLDASFRDDRVIACVIERLEVLERRLLAEGL
jgi:hypothetical protein